MGYLWSGVVSSVIEVLIETLRSCLFGRVPERKEVLLKDP